MPLPLAQHRCPGAEMRGLIYIGFGLWICFGVVLFVRYAMLAAQMMNHRVPKQNQFSFYAKASDYTEIGQGYRRKAIRTMIALMVYAQTVFIIVYWISTVGPRPH
jgi:hypothetical protein